MKRPKILQAFDNRSCSDVRRLTDDNLCTLHSYLLIEIIAVRHELRQRGMASEIKTELVYNGHMF